MSRLSTLRHNIFLRLNNNPKLNLRLKEISEAYISANDGIFLFYDDPTDEKKRHALRLARRITRELGSGLFDVEACQLFALAEAAVKIKGDMAEVGTYNGGSAKIICEVKGDTPLHLFDTFEGLPDVEQTDVWSGFGTAGRFEVGEYSAPLQTALNHLKDYQNVFFYKGIFPATATPVEGKTFSFVHLDVDTYKSTLSCLEFFYPRMKRCGIILSHDYLNAAGVTKAFDEFFEKKPEPVIMLTGRQCLTVKQRD